MTCPPCSDIDDIFINIVTKRDMKSNRKGITMTKLMILIFTALSLFLCLGCNPYEGDIYITTQADLDAFDYTHVYGSINIRDTELTNLAGMESLKWVERNLIIENNPSLTSLAGLENLTHVGRAVDINENDSLATLDGLEKLTGIKKAIVTTQKHIKLMRV